MIEIDLKGKNGLVLGVTNQRSIAWAIASPLAKAGARLAFSYQAERLRSGLEKLTTGLEDPVLVECDVQEDEQLDALFGAIEEEFGRLDFVVHSLAYAPQETFSAPFSTTSREDWRTAMAVSAYSLACL